MMVREPLAEASKSAFLDLMEFAEALKCRFFVLCADKRQHDLINSTRSLALIGFTLLDSESPFVQPVGMGQEDQLVYFLLDLIGG